MKNKKEDFKKDKKIDEILNKIDTKFIFEFSKKCFLQVQLMERMLKEERFRA